MATTQPTTSKELADVANFYENSGVASISLQPIENHGKALAEEALKLPLKTWYVYKHANLNPDGWKDLFEVITKKDKLKNFIAFQKEKDAVILHCCERPSSIKCRCLYYSQECSPVERLGKVNMNMLTAANITDLFANIFQALLEATTFNENYHCSTKVLILNGQSYQNDALNGAVALLKQKTSDKLSLTCGLKIQTILRPAMAMNSSDVSEKIQNNQRTYDGVDVDDILSSHALSDETVKILSEPSSDIVAALLKNFEKYMPIPTANIVSHPEWQQSVFSALSITSKHFQETTDIFNERYGAMFTSAYLEYLSDSDLNFTFFMFRSDIATIRYMEIDENRQFIQKWLQFQFGDDWLSFVKMIWKWLVRTDFKRGGLSIVGPPNSGKSFMFGALVDIFISIGYVPPNSGYTFNFDGCVNKQIILCEEFFVEKSDKHSIETIKDVLSGNAATVKIKNKSPACLKPTPWIFVSNEHNFRRDERIDNPWRTRLYQCDVREFTEWADRTHTYRLHPYGWIALFKELNLL